MCLQTQEGLVLMATDLAPQGFYFPSISMDWVGMRHAWSATCVCMQAPRGMVPAATDIAAGGLDFSSVIQRMFLDLPITVM